MYFVRTPYLVKKLFPEIIWEVSGNAQTIYLTFDDGPHPEITPWILKQLKQYNAKATFFCLGEHAEKFPSILHQILNDGHRVGNHGYNHLNGWKTSDEDYLENYLKAQDFLSAQYDCPIFRPAYGKIKKSQISNLKSQIPGRGTAIINWSLMPGDFDQSITSEQCFSNLQKVQSGDIVVLHDNEKAWKHLQYSLPKFLEFCKMKNYSLNTIDL